MDGGLIANNPALDLLTDFHKFNQNLLADVLFKYF